MHPATCLSLITHADDTGTLPRILRQNTAGKRLGRSGMCLQAHPLEIHDRAHAYRPPGCVFGDAYPNAPLPAVRHVPEEDASRLTIRRSC